MYGQDLIFWATSFVHWMTQIPARSSIEIKVSCLLIWWWLAQRLNFLLLWREACWMSTCSHGHSLVGLCRACGLANAITKVVGWAATSIYSLLFFQSCNPTGWFYHETLPNLIHIKPELIPNFVDNPIGMILEMRLKFTLFSDFWLMKELKLLITL